MPSPSRAAAAHLILLATLVTSACVPISPAHGPGRRGENGSVLASVEGIDRQDRDNPKVVFWLECRSGNRIKGEGAAGESIRFAGAVDIKAEDKCWLEVRVDEAEAQTLGYDWFGVKKDKSEDVGLLYGSTEAEVGASRAMSLTVYKLYSPKVPRPFKATLRGAFDTLEQAGTAPEDKTKGSLVCGAKSYPGTSARDAANATLVTFAFENLDAKEMKGVECKKLVVLVDNKEAFHADLTDVRFESPKKGDALSFPKDATTPPFKLQSSTTGDIVLDTETGGPCLHYVQGRCEDVRKAKLPFVEAFVLAKVIAAKTEAGGPTEKVTYLIGGGKGLELVKGGVLDLKNVKLQLAINEVAPYTVYKYESGLENAIMAAPFDAKIVDGTTFAAQKADQAELKGVQLLHIDSLYVHGFHSVVEDELNAMPGAHWLAVVKATKSSVADKEFIVSGAMPIFHSPTAPLAGRYFDLDSLVADMTAEDSSRWAVYALKDKAMATSTCVAEMRDYLDAVSARHLDHLKTGVDAKLDDCRVAPAAFDSELLGATATTALSVWGWFKFDVQAGD